MVVTCSFCPIHCGWGVVSGLLLPDCIYTIGTTVLNGGISMVVFYLVNKKIFPSAGAA